MGDIIVYGTAILIAMLSSFALGIYVATQIGEWIKRNTKE